MMNNLEENTTYYVRAFATNSAGTGYGNIVTFTTPANITLPLVDYSGYYQSQLQHGDIRRHHHR